MSNEKQKGESELERFRLFVKSTDLPIDLNSIEKRNPPEPDILCRDFVEGYVAFELVELCDRNLAKSMAQANDAYLRTSDPSLEVISKKLSRNYESGGVPIELLCYSGRIITPDNSILPTIKPLFEACNHAFRRAWLMGKKGTYIIWHSN